METDSSPLKTPKKVNFMKILMWAYSIVSPDDLKSCILKCKVKLSNQIDTLTFKK